MALRALTPKEIDAAKNVFQQSILYSQVRVQVSIT